jgi:uncharacterized lipoprotein YmbA
MRWPYTAILLLVAGSLTGCSVRPQTNAYVFQHQNIPWIKCLIVIDTSNTSREVALQHVDVCRSVVEHNTKPSH